MSNTSPAFVHRPLLALGLALASVAFAAVTAAHVSAAATQSPQVVIITSAGKPITTVRVEIAATPGAREFGLMYRDHLDEDAGMIFLFAAPQHLTFWMKNTEIPLDMIFADGSGQIVGIVANARPLTLESRNVNGNSQYVLEVNGGFCKRHGVKPGDRLQFIGFSPRAAK